MNCAVTSDLEMGQTDGLIFAELDLDFTLDSVDSRYCTAAGGPSESTMPSALCRHQQRDASEFASIWLPMAR